MRHRKRTIKLGRTGSHRDAMLANQVCSLIAAKRIKTTLAKAKVLRSVAEKMVTLGKQETLSARRRALATLKNTTAVGELFSSVAPAFKDRQGGYTRIYKLGKRASDGSEMALIEWVNYVPPAPKKTVEKPAKPGDESKG
ncbi:MAG TPA: 50S ribosomal protein L17 [Kiritimatiellia bacterium]|nr:50S ribosomal protein L17 [Kiritimatiellia bacterium]HMO98849.1 50S ribosomal protein L17 [Kiritimatiellia bacterium]HMP96204.1 50S ribosomal protein L17 [Kiritimatiellia bacterium]